MPQECYRCAECVDTVDRCETCRARRRAATNERRDRRRKARLCLQCGQPVARRGRRYLVRCERHTERANAISLASHTRARAARK